MVPGDDVLGARLGDKRRAGRASSIVARLAARPGLSIAEAFGEGSELDLAYRWLSNDEVDWHAVQLAHSVATWQRALETDVPLVLHDTTDIAFALRNGRLRKDLASLTPKTQGFYVHLSMLADGASGQVFGAVRAAPYVHGANVEELPHAKAFWQNQGGLFENEGDRWWQAIESVEAAAPHRSRPIHVGDREADDYSLFAKLRSSEIRFVLRLYRERKLVDDGVTQTTTISSRLNAVSWRKSTREIYISARSSDRNAKDMKTNPPRGGRAAVLSFRGCQIELARTKHIRDRNTPATVVLNIVEVLERNPPGHEAPVHWLLATSEPIETDNDLLRVVEIYRKRWFIEEFFKCLKSGCLIEKAQLDSAAALLRLLAVLMPIATYLMHLRFMVREHIDEPANHAFSDEQIAVLKAEHPECFENDPPTVAEAITAIGRLGGLLSRNKNPGLLVLSRGTTALFLMLKGWRLGQRHRPPD